jgi:hypothetical protein
MGSSIIVGAISVITRKTGTRPASIWIGSTGPLVLPDGVLPEGVGRGGVFRAVFHTGLDGALIVENLLPMTAPPSPS